MNTTRPSAFDLRIMIDVNKAAISLLPPALEWTSNTVRQSIMFHKLGSRQIQPLIGFEWKSLIATKWRLNGSINYAIFSNIQQ